MAFVSAVGWLYVYLVASWICVAAGGERDMVISRSDSWACEWHWTAALLGEGCYRECRLIKRLFCVYGGWHQVDIFFVMSLGAQVCTKSVLVRQRSLHSLFPYLSVPLYHEHEGDHVPRVISASREAEISQKKSR